MTDNEIERRVKLVLEAQRILKELKELGLIRASYEPITTAMLNSALRNAGKGECK